MKENTQNSSNVISRPPIVVIMGHIDHGKTTLLDAIRKTNVVAEESGGITQHIGAYEVVFGDKRLTFIDTPGHEAFSQMRSRGANVADIAVLVVAADDSVKPQTREALLAIQASKIPFCVAINKIDKSTGDPERVKTDLSQEGVFVEGRGGTVPVVEISAKAQKNVDKLLETILLLAELEELKSNPQQFAEGVVIESHRDPQRGITATLLVRDGTLKKNEYVLAGPAFTKTRILENFRGEAIETAGPSMPVVVVGFDTLPPVGAAFRAFFSQKEAVAAQRIVKDTAKQAVASTVASGVVSSSGDEAPKEIIVALIIKSDTEGSAEALVYEIKKLQKSGFVLRFLKVESGDVSLDDMGLARSAEHPVIVAFRVGIKPGVADLGEKIGIAIVRFDIIYEVSDFLKKHIESILPPEVRRTALGKAKIVKIFKEEGKSQIVGGRALEGLVRRGMRFVLTRRGAAIGEGSIEGLQSGKIAVSEVEQGGEFGAQTKSSLSVAPEDVLELFEETTIKRIL